MKMQKVSYKGAIEYTKYILPIYSTDIKMACLFLAIRMLDKRRIIKLQKLPIYSVDKNGFEHNYFLIETKQKKIILADNLITSKFEKVSRFQISRIEEKAFNIIKQIQAKNKASKRYRLAKELESVLNIVF